jgi:hypothetical protein
MINGSECVCKFYAHLIECAHMRVIFYRGFRPSITSSTFDFAPLLTNCSAFGIMLEANPIGENRLRV